MIERVPLIWLSLLIASVTAFFSLSLGSSMISFSELFFGENTILLTLRLPRTLTAFTTGGLLALSGCLMQLLLQNPLADPYALGISSGAALSTLLLMLLGFSEIWLLPGAWAGSLITISFIFFLANHHHFRSHSLLLIGIALTSGLSACISVVLLLSAETNLHSMLFWLSGDISETDIPYFSLSLLLIGGLLCYLLAPALNILGRGEKEAKALGLASETYRLIIFLLASLFTATAVTLSGCIGFVGLIIPHLARMLTHFDHRIILPVATLLGGSLLMLADTLARILFAPQQLPVGILIAIIGVPIFIWLIQAKYA